MSIGFVYTNDYLKHDTGDHPERRERYVAALSGLISDSDLWESLVKIDPRSATDDDLLQCHSVESIERIGMACSQASFTNYESLDSDTVVSEYSDYVARLAAGGACRAIDAVMNDEADSVFVACRPPGHHATPAGAMGFCLYNNVAIAARYAQKKYPDRIKRILIMDFDVHHGNGTQEIFYEDSSVFYFSTHQYPWYPGTGGENERGANEGEGYTLNIPIRALTPIEDQMRLFEEGMETAMKKLSPDLVIISAGFDAHQSDPLGQLMLSDDCYRQMTRRLKEAARATGEGRIISCLEGGYNLQTLGETVHAHVLSLE